jgi:mono/diheme cytochrome c family protein
MKQLILVCLIFSGASLALAQDTATLDRGKVVYEYWCQTCHGEGDQYPGTVALSVKYGGELPAALEQRTDLTPVLIKTFVRNGVSVMPFFRKTEISDSDLEALAQYLTASDRQAQQ